MLGKVALFADAAADSLDRLTDSLRASQRSMSAFLTGQSRLRGSLEMTADVAGDSSVAFGGALHRMSLSARRASMSIAASTASIRKSIGSAASLSERKAAGGVASGAGWLGPAVTGGVAAALFLGAGIHTAAGIQSSAAQSGVASGRSTDDMLRTYAPLAMRMSNITAQSEAQSMRLLNIATTSGLSAQQLTGADGKGKLAMAIAQYADTQFLGPHHTSFDESTRTAATIAHQFGARNGDELSKVLNSLFKLSNDMPDAVGRAANQLKYYAPQFMNAGLVPHGKDQDTASQILLYQGTLDRLGLGTGRSGTGMRALLAEMQKPSSGSVFAAQKALGIVGPDGKNRFINQKTGAFDIQGLFTMLHREYDKSRQDGTAAAFNRTLQGISTSGAAPLIALLTSDAGQSQFRAVQATMSRIHDLSAAQEQLMNTLDGQTQRFVTNVTTLAGVLAGPLIVPLTNFLHNAADLTGDLATWFSDHPTATNIGAAALTGAGVLGVYGLARRFGPHVGLSLADAEKSRLATAVGGLLRDTISGSSVRGMLGTGVSRAANYFRPLTVGVFDNAGALVRSFAGSITSLIGPASDAVGVTRFLAMGVGRFGLAAIPVVGDMFLLGQGLQFLGNHSRDIGKWIGEAAHWLVAHGGPMLRDAFVSMVRAIVDGIKATWASFFNGGHGGLIGWIKDVVTSAQAGYKAGYDGAAADDRAATNEQRYLDYQRAKHMRQRTRDTVRARPLRPGERAPGGTHLTVNGGVHVHTQNERQSKNVVNSLATGATSTPYFNSAMSKPAGAS